MATSNLNSKLHDLHISDQECLDANRIPTSKLHHLHFSDKDKKCHECFDANCPDNSYYRGPPLSVPEALPLQHVAEISHCHGGSSPNVVTAEQLEAYNWFEAIYNKVLERTEAQNKARGDEIFSDMLIWYEDDEDEDEDEDDDDDEDEDVVVVEEKHVLNSN